MQLSLSIALVPVKTDQVPDLHAAPEGGILRWSLHKVSAKVIITAGYDGRLFQRAQHSRVAPSPLRSQLAPLDGWVAGEQESPRRVGRRLGPAAFRLELPLDDSHTSALSTDTGRTNR